MKLSLAWIFDHINSDWKKHNVDHLVAQFNRVTAEMEHAERVSYDLAKFFVGTVKNFSAAGVTLTLPEQQKDIQLPPNTTINESTKGYGFMVKQTGSTFTWATPADFGSEKEGVLPAFEVNEQLLAGGWRELWGDTDVIIEVDNKSITHRPDMWGHRGFAREIAAFLDLEFMPADKFLQNIPVLEFDRVSQQTMTCPITLENSAPQGCRRFAGLYFTHIANKPSNFFIASRLLKVGMRPINGIVDMTNYLMHDWGQPSHAYDADKLAGKKMVIRMAHEQEELVLLKGEKITLTAQDVVVADAQTPQALAGVKGGAGTAVDAATKHIFFEAATFDAGYIRKSAQRHKTRTDGSARHEKTLDPNLTVQGVQRFVKLLMDFGYSPQHAEEIIVVGKEAEPLTIEVSHAFIEARMGMPFASSDIMTILRKLEFHVLKSADMNKNIIYVVTVPSFRSSKDVKIKEDILEEIVRCYGFDKLQLQLPQITRNPFSLRAVQRLSAIKEYGARALAMTEQQNYSMADEYFVASLGLKPQAAVTLINPVSENHCNMITSLIPGLLKNIQENHLHRDALDFFECGRIWVSREGKPVELRQVAGIFFKKRSDVNFYSCKHKLQQLFVTLGFDEQQLTWKQAAGDRAPWYREYQSATLWYGDQLVGIAGLIDQPLLSKLSIDTQADAFVFELDGDFLHYAPGKPPRYRGLSKFQDTYVDLSLMVPLVLKAADLVTSMRGVDSMIDHIETIDMFENPAWTDVRALTFRVWLSSHEKTLEKAEIDDVWKRIVAVLTTHGVQVRS